MIRLFLARRLGLFVWRTVERSGKWRLREHILTGKRATFKAGPSGPPNGPPPPWFKRPPPPPLPPMRLATKGWTHGERPITAAELVGSGSRT